MEKTTLALEKLTCPSCMVKITDTVNALEGVEKTKILFNSSKARIIFDQEKISEEDIIHTIVDLGYAAKKVMN